MAFFNKKIVALVIAAGVLPVALVVAAVIMAQAKKSQTITLANGKSVNLDESVATLKSSFATDINEVAPGVFRYPADTKLPAEVDIYTDKNRVAAILLGRNSNHFQVSNKLHLGMTGATLSALFGGNLQAINTQTDFVKLRGYRVSSIGAVSYYMTQTCTHLNGDNVEYLAVVKPGSEKVVNFLNHPLTCKPYDLPPAASVTNAKK